MASHKATKKSIKQSAKTNMRNNDFKSQVKTAIKKAKKAIKHNEPDKEQLVNNAVKLIDKANNKGVYHANKTIRQKSQLMKLSIAANKKD